MSSEARAAHSGLGEDEPSAHSGLGEDEPSVHSGLGEDEPPAISGLGEDEPPVPPSLAGDLLAWYARERRDLPWRRSRDPYRVWVSEIMLQQTQVATAVGYYERWMQRFPDVASLASADPDLVLRTWEGLGYYSRARNLLAAARAVVSEHGGELPRTPDSLRRLPGIGRYSAGAIASIAYGVPEPAVDGNLERVLTRLFALGGDPKRSPLATRIWRLARRLLEGHDPGELNQALMELGATCCTPKRPRCESCPVATHCEALRQGRVDELPESSKRPTVVDELRAAGVVRRRGKVLILRQAKAAARWAGMWMFPEAVVAPGADAGAVLRQSVRERAGLDIQSEGRSAVIQHRVTRFRIRLEVHPCRVLGGRSRAEQHTELCWRSPEELSTLAMPAAHRKIARGLL